MSETVQPGAAAPDRKAETGPAEGEPRLEARARVLVVEDEHELRELIARWLETKGYIVTEAVDGQDAVDLLEAGLEPDVILLDLGLPRMDGRTFLDWMRAQPKHAHRRVVVASAYLDDLPPVEADRTFAKPFRPDRLAAELDRLTSE
jgi:CheY-like chemotaxis protein